MARTRSKTALPTTPPTPGDAVDIQLARYRSMRDFGITAEPAGKAKLTASSQLPFVIQKHAATRHHYDFRLGWNGVLKSWAVAKGPSYNVKDKRLAVQVEDHPMEYGGFEGIIPKGQYGGGTVMVWDQGTWEPHVDVDEGLRKGNLKFSLNGTKMHGNWTLVRMGGKAANESKPNWLLIKEHDDLERTSEAPCITEEAPDSAVTGRSLEQIAAAGTHVWNSKETAGTGQAWFRQPETVPAPAQKSSTRNAEKHVDKAALRALPKEALPAFIKPQLAQEADAPPTRGTWLHELKLDGYRVQARKHGGTVELLTRTGLDWTHRMKSVAASIARLQGDLLLDGEVVVLDETGVSSFARLQASFEKNERHPLTYFVFDLLHLNGHSTRDLPLLERKRILHDLVGDDTEEFRISEHVDAPGEAVFHKACELHAEGIISKKADAKYTSGRGASWVKSKCLHEQEFVIGGWTDLSNGQHGIGSLLLGYYDAAGKLIYAGRTGTGFTQKTHRMLCDKVDAMAQTTNPFAVISTEGRRGAHWVRPQLVAQVRFATWTGENQLRQAAFLGLREDKPACDVHRVEAAPQPKRDRKASLAKQAPAEEKTLTAKATRPRGHMKPLQPLVAPAIRLTHPAKVLDPASGLTKQQLATYLFTVAPQMLPHIAGRPLSLVRCPEGSGKPCFYQKHTNHMLPPGVGSVMVPDKKTGKPDPYITLDNAEALAGLAQMSVLEVHPWGSRNADLEHPDRLIIDLDPDESLPWETLAEAANDVRLRLKKLKLESFVKTTGGKGLHVVFPVTPDHDFETMKTWARGFVLEMERANPRLYLTKMTKAARAGKIYLDYLRNERGATAVAPFSTRSRPGTTVSVPLAWKELESRTRPSFSVPGFESWRDRLRADPWKKMLNLQQAVSPESLERFAGRLKRSA